MHTKALLPGKPQAGFHFLTPHWPAYALLAPACVQRRIGSSRNLTDSLRSDLRLQSRRLTRDTNTDGPPCPVSLVQQSVYQAETALANVRDSVRSKCAPWCPP